MAQSKSGSKPASWDAIARYAVLAGWVFGIGGIIVAGAVLGPRLMERTAQAQPSAPIRVVLANEPQWLPPADRRTIELSVLKSLTGGPLDREGLIAARAAVEASGWFERVVQVRRVDLDQVVVEGTWSRPFALITDGTGEHLVDPQARLLPRTYAAGQGPNLLRITGVAAPCPASVGSAWGGDDIAVALEMAALMSEKPWKHQIAAIEMSGYGRDANIRLRTDTGCELLWGRAAGQENAMEVPAHQKLAALQYLYEHQGRIDAGCDKALDLRADVVGAR